AGANFTLLAVTIAVVAVLLLLTYRSPILWLVPLAVVALADGAAGAVTSTLGEQLSRLRHRCDQRAGVRCGHQLRPAADLPLSRGAASPHGPPRRAGHRLGAHGTRDHRLQRHRGAGADDP